MNKDTLTFNPKVSYVTAVRSDLADKDTYHLACAYLRDNGVNPSDIAITLAKYIEIPTIYVIKCSRNAVKKAYMDFEDIFAHKHSVSKNTSSTTAESKNNATNSSSSSSSTNNNEERAHTQWAMHLLKPNISQLLQGTIRSQYRSICINFKLIETDCKHSKYDNNGYNFQCGILQYPKEYYESVINTQKMPPKKKNNNDDGDNKTNIINDDSSSDSDDELRLLYMDGFINEKRKNTSVKFDTLITTERNQSKHNRKDCHYDIDAYYMQCTGSDNKIIPKANYSCYYINGYNDRRANKEDGRSSKLYRDKQFNKKYCFAKNDTLSIVIQRGKQNKDHLYYAYFTKNNVPLNRENKVNANVDKSKNSTDDANSGGGGGGDDDWLFGAGDPFDEIIVKQNVDGVDEDDLVELDFEENVYFAGISSLVCNCKKTKGFEFKCYFRTFL